MLDATIYAEPNVKPKPTIASKCNDESVCESESKLLTEHAKSRQPSRSFSTVVAITKPGIGNSSDAIRDISEAAPANKPIVLSDAADLAEYYYSVHAKPYPARKQRICFR